MHIPEPKPKEYYHWDKMWLVRTPDGIPIGISLEGGFIGGSHWFRTQLERILHGMKPEGEPCKIFVTDPGLLRRNPNVKRLPFYRSLPTPRGSPSLS
jgi:hypothetical protein